MRERCYYVYIMGSLSGTLYIGMTNNLHKRVWQHKQHEFEGFTEEYEADRLLYWESFDDVRNAIDREKQLKRWRRDKKVWLIERMNPSWKDLARGWYETSRGPSTSLAGARSARDDIS
jgi:putative endonuclease